MGEMPHDVLRIRSKGGVWGISPKSCDVSGMWILVIQKNLMIVRFFLTVMFGTAMLTFRRIKEKS